MIHRCPATRQPKDFNLLTSGRSPGYSSTWINYKRYEKACYTASILGAWQRHNTRSGHWPATKIGDTRVPGRVEAQQARETLEMEKFVSLTQTRNTWVSGRIKAQHRRVSPVFLSQTRHIGILWPVIIPTATGKTKGWAFLSLTRNANVPTTIYVAANGLNKIKKQFLTLFRIQYLTILCTTGDKKHMWLVGRRCY